MAGFTGGHRLPDRQQVSSRVVSAALVGATLFVLDRSPTMAGATAIGFLALTLAGDTAEAAIGDYAGNALFGLVTLGFTAAFLWPWLPGAVVGSLLGGWLLVDGVQHLRHGQSRAEVSAPFRHDGSPLTGIPRAVIGRLTAPFRL